MLDALFAIAVLVTGSALLGAAGACVIFYGLGSPRRGAR